MGVTRRGLVRLAAFGAATAALAACGGGVEVAAPGAPPAKTEGGSPRPAYATSKVVTLARPRARRMTLYSGRNQNLIEPALEQFRRIGGVRLEVRYGATSEMAATILEEGRNSPADAFLAQDAGALGAVAKEGLFALLPETLTERVEPRFRSPIGEWIGLTGRARVIVYNTELVSNDQLPASVLGLTDRHWEDRVGWAPTNGSFQAFVTAMRLKLGEAAALDWLKGVQANRAKVYKDNTAIVEAAINGDVYLGLVNHYYLMQQLKARPDAPARNLFLKGGDPGALVNVTGMGVLATAKDSEAAVELGAHLLGEEAQRYFAQETFEYPLIQQVAAHPDLPPLASIETPDMDLSDLADLKATLELLQKAGVL